MKYAADAILLTRKSFYLYIFPFKIHQQPIIQIV